MERKRKMRVEITKKEGQKNKEEDKKERKKEKRKENPIQRRFKTKTDPHNNK